MTATLAAIEDLGHEVVEVSPPFNDSLLPMFTALWSSLALLTPIDEEDEGRLQP